MPFNTPEWKINIALFTIGFYIFLLFAYFVLWKLKMKSGMVTGAFNPESENRQKTSLVNLVSSKPSKATQGWYMAQNK